jgi:hypothetical protein
MIVRAFGLFWSISGIDWDNGVMRGIFDGRDEETGRRIHIDSNAWAQSGVYCLYHEFTPIYVGRALKGNMGVRINAHRDDRLAGRWDSFSWFGTHKVNLDGSLRPFNLRLTRRAQIVKSLEAFALIAFDPRLNRRHESLPEALEFMQQVEKPRAIRTLVEEIEKTVSAIDKRTRRIAKTGTKPITK